MLRGSIKTQTMWCPFRMNTRSNILKGRSKFW